MHKEWDGVSLHPMPEDTELVTITVSGVPRDLLLRLEKAATTEHRNRSNWIVKTIAEAVEDARRNKRAGKIQRHSHN